MKILLSLACCLLAALLAGCAPASSASASTSLPDSGSPASVSQPAGESAASEAPEWTDEAVMELFLAQEQNAPGNDHILALQAAGLLEHGGVGGVVEHHLQNAGGVAQVGKDDAALIPAFGDGTGHHHLLARIGQTHFAAITGAAQISHGFHNQ